MSMILNSLAAQKPKVNEARYENGVLYLVLGGTALEGSTLSVPVRTITPLARLSEEQLAKVEVKGNGHILVWRDGNEDFNVAGLIERITGLKTHRAHMAQIGAISTEAKAAAARANGAKGGRPRKNPEAPKAE